MSRKQGKEIQRDWVLRNPKRAWAVSASYRIRQRAARRGVPFDIDYKYIYNIAPDICPVFGTPFVFYGAGGHTPESPTVDRLDPAKGYVAGNITIISAKANSIKSAFAADDIWKVALWLSGKSE